MPAETSDAPGGRKPAATSSPIISISSTRRSLGSKASAAAWAEMVRPSAWASGGGGRPSRAGGVAWFIGATMSRFGRLIDDFENDLLPVRHVPKLLMDRAISTHVIRDCQRATILHCVRPANHGRFLEAVALTRSEAQACGDNLIHE